MTSFRNLLLPVLAAVLLGVILDCWPGGVHRGAAGTGHGSPAKQSHGFPYKPARGAVDEQARSYAGVRLGEPIASARRRLRNRLPVGRIPVDQFVFPPFLPADSPKDDVYPDVGMTLKNHRVASIIVYGEGARTSRGVAMGDPIDRVKEIYPGAECEDAGYSGEWYHEASCDVHLSPHVTLYFAADPIELIAMWRHG